MTAFGVNGKKRRAYLCPRSQRIGILLRYVGKMLEQLQPGPLRSIWVLRILACRKLSEKLLHLPKHILVLCTDLALLLVEQVAQFVALRTHLACQRLRRVRFGLQVVDALRQCIPFRAMLVDFS